MTTPILLSGFADEAANEKLAVQQYSAFAALGPEVLLDSFHRRR